MANNVSEEFLFAAKFYNNPNDAALFPPEKRNPEGKTGVNTEGKAVKQQEKTATK